MSGDSLPPDPRTYRKNGAMPPSRRLPRVVTAPEEQPRPINPKLFPEGVCSSCRKLTLHALLTTYDRSDGYCLLSCSRDLPTTCPMCRMIFSFIIPGIEVVGDIHVRLNVNERKPVKDISRGQNLREVCVENYSGGHINIVGGAKFRIYADPESYASKFVLGRRAPSSNLSDATFKTIASWMKDCDETHTTCRNHPFQSPKAARRYLPTRVVHVGSATRQPHLHISQSQQSDRYVALSHCWGTLAQVKTLDANIERFRGEIAFEDLSNTFQDAIRVTRRLGIQYIWIDSLCIVQDDKDDWLRESARMGNVYANAYVTLAATWAADGSGGLDSVRPSSNWIKFPCDGSDESRGYMWFTDAAWTSQSDLDDAALNKRGWVFQEKILSRRIIHFASSQVYWECKNRFVGEEREDEIHFTGRTLEPSQFWADVNALSYNGPIPTERSNVVRDPGYPRSQLDEFYESWRTFVRYYCARKFTKTSDRLVALLGIIRVVEERTGLRCIDGHWDDGSWRFVRELMWYPKGHNTIRLPRDDRRSRLCSSWSWASLAGLVEHDILAIAAWKDYGLEDCDLHLKAIKREVHVPWESHPLEVSGMLRAVSKGECEGGASPGQNNVENRAYEVMAETFQKVDGWVSFDWKDEEPEQFYLSPVYLSSSKIACLALVERHEASTRERYFERVGVGHIHVLIRSDGATSGNIGFFDACERLTYYII